MFSLFNPNLTDLKASTHSNQHETVIYALNYDGCMVSGNRSHPVQDMLNDRPLIHMIYSDCRAGKRVIIMCASRRQNVTTCFFLKAYKKNGLGPVELRNFTEELNKRYKLNVEYFDYLVQDEQIKKSDTFLSPNNTINLVIKLNNELEALRQTAPQEVEDFYKRLRQSLGGEPAREIIQQFVLKRWHFIHKEDIVFSCNKYLHEPDDNNESKNLLLYHLMKCARKKWSGRITFNFFDNDRSIIQSANNIPSDMIPENMILSIYKKAKKGDVLSHSKIIYSTNKAPIVEHAQNNFYTLSKDRMSQSHELDIRSQKLFYLENDDISIQIIPSAIPDIEEQKGYAGKVFTTSNTKPNTERVAPNISPYQFVSLFNSQPSAITQHNISTQLKNINITSVSDLALILTSLPGNFEQICSLFKNIILEHIKTLAQLFVLIEKLTGDDKEHSLLLLLKDNLQDMIQDDTDVNAVHVFLSMFKEDKVWHKTHELFFNAIKEKLSKIIKNQKDFDRINDALIYQEQRQGFSIIAEPCKTRRACNDNSLEVKNFNRVTKI